MQYSHRKAEELSFYPGIDIDWTFQKEGKKLLEPVRTSAKALRQLQGSQREPFLPKGEITLSAPVSQSYALRQ